MAIHDDDDLLEIFTDNGETISVNGVDIKAIFDADYFELLGSEQAGVQGTRPGAECRTSDVSAVSVGDPVIVDGVSYTVIRPEKKGPGVTVLVLEEV